MGERPSLGIRAASPVQQLLSHPTSPCLSFPNLQMGQLRHRDGVTGPAVSHCRGEWQPKLYSGLAGPGAFPRCSVLLSPSHCPQQQEPCGTSCTVPARRWVLATWLRALSPLSPPLALRC